MHEADGLLPWTDWPAVCADDDAKVLLESAGYLELDNLGLLKVHGPDAASFLNGLLTADTKRQKPGSVTEAWALDATGKILFHLHVARPETDTFYLSCAISRMQDLTTHLDKYLVMEEAQLTPLPDLRCFSLQGPRAAGAGKDLPEGVRLDPVDRCGLGGFDLFVPQSDTAICRTALEDAGIAPIGHDALHRVRLLHGVPLFGTDMAPQTHPLIYGKGGERISYTKGCFLGQEPVARARDRGKPPKLLVSLHGADTDPPPVDMELLSADKVVGVVTSASPDPHGAGVRALAVVKHASARVGDGLVDTSGHLWEITQVSTY